MDELREAAAAGFQLQVPASGSHAVLQQSGSEPHGCPEGLQQSDVPPSGEVQAVVQQSFEDVQPC
jgi:hypothetical protein